MNNFAPQTPWWRMPLRSIAYRFLPPKREEVVVFGNPWLTIVRQGGIPIGVHMNDARPTSVLVNLSRRELLHGLIAGVLELRVDMLAPVEGDVGLLPTVEEEIVS